MDYYEFEFLNCSNLDDVKKQVELHVNSLGYTLVSVVPFTERMVETVDGEPQITDSTRYFVTLQKRF